MQEDRDRKGEGRAKMEEDNRAMGVSGTRVLSESEKIDGVSAKWGSIWWRGFGSRWRYGDGIGIKF